MRRTFKLLIIASLASVFVCTVALPLHAETWRFNIDSAVARAKSENRDIKTMIEKLTELAGMKGEAASQGLPQFTMGIGYLHTWQKPEMIISGQSFRIGNSNTYSASTKASQLVWDGGKVLKAIKAAKLEEAKGHEDIEAVQNNIVYQVRDTFYQILYVKKVIGVLEEQLRQLNTHLNALRKRYNKGVESDYTLMRQEVAVSNLTPQLIDVKRQKEDLLNQFKLLLVVPHDDTIDIDGSLTYTPNGGYETNALIEKALAVRPDLQSEKYREKSLEQNVGIESANYYPKIGLQGGIEWQGYSDHWAINSKQHTYSITGGVNLTWPIFDGLKTASRVKQARSKLVQQKYATSQEADSVAKEVQNANIAFERARETYKSQAHSVDTARRASKIANERFAAGLMSQVELLDTITAQAQAEQQYYGAIYDCLSAKAALTLAVGGNL